jgi:glycosyltransferase involved in cell wall biosynthesis
VLWLEEIHWKHRFFNDSPRKHVLLITNHGCHAPQIVVTVDTGGQNIYVNNLSKALVRLGYKVTILNRGGFPHPVTGEMQRGVTYYDRVWGDEGLFSRVVYLEDGFQEFVPKEELNLEHLEKEKDFFMEVVREQLALDLEGFHFISSHYWDGALLGVLITEELTERGFSTPAHVFTPHSLGVLKKERFRNASSQDVARFRFQYRIAQEERCIANSCGVVATSHAIEKALKRYHSRPKRVFWFPPAVDTEVFYPRKINECSLAIEVLGRALGISRERVVKLLEEKVVFLELSRTARTKQKGLVLTAFASMKNRRKTLLVMNVDSASPLYPSIMRSYHRLGADENVVIVDWLLNEEEVAQLFALAQVFITASLMEGWGMAVQEAAASRCAVISSPFVPFVYEVLGEAALIVEKNTPLAYAERMDLLVENAELMKRIGEEAYLKSQQHSWVSSTRRWINAMEEAGLIVV